MRIVATGSVVGKTCVSNAELEKKLGLKAGWISKNCGVERRFHIDGEEASEMGAQAALIAVERSGLKLEEIDLVIGVSGVPQQAIPSMAALIHKKLRLKATPTFDVNATCLSFLSGLSIADQLQRGGLYRRILLVSADIASVGLNPNDPKTATLFGDGAAAVIVEASESGALVSSFETWTEVQEACQFEMGGTKLHLKEVEEHRKYFQMKGPRLFKTAIPHGMRMVETLLDKAGLTMDQLALFIPHQASPSALNIFSKLLKKKYKDFVCPFMNIVQDYGNMIATSLPHALNQAIEQKLLKRGDRCMLLGTSAGISVGGVIVEY